MHVCPALVPPLMEPPDTYALSCPVMSYRIRRSLLNLPSHTSYSATQGTGQGILSVDMLLVLCTLLTVNHTEGLAVALAQSGLLRAVAEHACHLAVRRSCDGQVRGVSGGKQHGLIFCASIQLVCMACAISKLGKVPLTAG